MQALRSRHMPAGIEASRRAQIPSPPAEPPVFVLWFNQVTRPVLWWTAANPACRLRLWSATLHRLLSTTSSCFACHHAACTWPRWPPGPSSWAYLSLHSSEAPQGIDLSLSLFTCTNANQVATCTCNTWPTVSPHHVFNYSSQPRETIHRSSDAPVLNQCKHGEWCSHAPTKFCSSQRSLCGALSTFSSTTTKCGHHWKIRCKKHIKHHNHPNKCSPIGWKNANIAYQLGRLHLAPPGQFIRGVVQTYYEQGYNNQYYQYQPPAED
jgi:hypothetical protein